MKRRMGFAVVIIALFGLSSPVLSQQAQLPRRLGGANGPRVAPPATRPVPKLADGTVDLFGV